MTLAWRASPILVLDSSVLRRLVQQLHLVVGTTSLRTIIISRSHGLVPTCHRDKGVSSSLDNWT
uniref:Uncharacterized protein n=1 Tax=Zea mays TaxID=4577 RepID=C0PI97_MAIZE|nr:unknown [Zea mays]